MKKVLFRAPVLTQSGYGQHARQVMSWLLTKHDIELYVQPLPWGGTPWLLDTTDLDGFVGKIMEHAIPTQGPVDVSIQLQLPNEWDPKLAKFNVGMTAAVESDRCHPDWITACNNMNTVIVPSNHARLNLTSTGDVKVPLLVIPEAYTESCGCLDEELPSNVFPTFSTPFNFLVFGQITGNNPESDRKNTFYTLKWLMETFSNDPDVGIVLKTNVGKNSLMDKRAVNVMIQGVINEVRKGPFPRIHLIHGNLHDDEVASLYRHPQVKALVALTRGEGYGLPILESAVSGLPIIATNWSGHLDFLNHGKFISVYYKLGDVHPSRIDEKIFVKGSRWAQPSEQDFKSRVKKFRNNSDIPKQWALELKQKLHEMYSLKKIFEAYSEALKEVI